MATAELATRPQQDRPRRKPFTQWVKNLTNLKDKSNGKKGNKKSAAAAQPGGAATKNSPYPQSAPNLQHSTHARQSPASSTNGHLSFSTPIAHGGGHGSFASLPHEQDRDAQSRSNRSGAPTLATNPETIHSDAGASKAATITTHGGALSSLDGQGPDSTFSSPSQSQHSLTTTLTTIQSTSAGNALNAPSSGAHPHSNLHSPNPVMFSHQYPVSPAPSAGNTISAIPRHVADSMPNTYNSATANGLLSDNASILTLASSSKRRRRSMDTDASVRALAPSSVWGGSRESLPLSVLSGNPDSAPPTSGGGFYTSQSRPSIGGLASTERASIYSTGIASERNSYSYRPGGKDLADAKSLRSITNMDARSLAGDARSVNADAKSLGGGDVVSLRNNEGSIRSAPMDHGHTRSDSVPNSIGSPLTHPRHLSGTGQLSRRSSDMVEVEENEDAEEEREEDNQERR